VEISNGFSHPLSVLSTLAAFCAPCACWFDREADILETQIMGIRFLPAFVSAVAVVLTC